MRLDYPQNWPSAWQDGIRGHPGGSYLLRYQSCANTHRKSNYICSDAVWKYIFILIYMYGQ